MPKGTVADYDEVEEEDGEEEEEEEEEEDHDEKSSEELSWGCKFITKASAC